jgi:hypothetical protein
LCEDVRALCNEAGIDDVSDILTASPPPSIDSNHKNMMEVAHRSCFMKGDCQRFGRQALFIGERLEKLMTRSARNRQDPDDISDHGLELSVWDVAPTGSPRNIIMVAHALLNPIRIIVVPCRPTYTDVYEFTWVDDRLNYRSLYEHVFLSGFAESQQLRVVRFRTEHLSA